MQEKEEVPLFLNEFFNIKTYNKTAGDAQFAVGRIINAITSVVNDKGATLPKYLVVILDHDIIRDIDDVFTTEAPHAIATLTDWTVRQINLIIHRKWVDLLDKKPGSLSGLSTSIVFIRMLKLIGSFQPGSRLQGIFNLRAKFNNSLNDAVVKINQHMLTTNSCNAYEHFDK